jgi:hypothetical protein
MLELATAPHAYSGVVPGGGELHHTTNLAAGASERPPPILSILA